MTTSIQTTAARYETLTAGDINIIGWRREVDGTARFSVWNDESILPNVAWPDAFAFIANRGRNRIATERMLRSALALNEGR